MTAAGPHPVVIGASMGRLLAAAGLGARHERVTVPDRVALHGREARRDAPAPRWRPASGAGIRRVGAL